MIKVNDILNDFVYIAAHDLKSPVNNMTMLIQIIKDETNPGRKEETFLLLEKSILRLERTLRGLVEIIKNTNEESVACQMEFKEILQIVIDDLSVPYPDISEYIDSDFKNCISTVYIKPFLISIIKNLISNSYKYKSDRRELKISLITDREDGFVKLEVRDNGIGYDMNKVKDIFAPFKRFTRKGEGAGVGLYVLKNIVEKNGGKVEAKGKEDDGTVMTVYLKEYQPTHIVNCPPM